MRDDPKSAAEPFTVVAPAARARSEPAMDVRSGPEQAPGASALHHDPDLETTVPRSGRGMEKAWGIVKVLGVLVGLAAGVLALTVWLSSAWGSSQSVSIPLQGKWGTHATPGSKIHIRRHKSDVVVASFSLKKGGYV